MILPEPGLFRHFKGHPYWVHRVLRNATNTARYAPMVQYEAIYARPDDLDPLLRVDPGHFARDVSEFNEQVAWPDGVSRARWVKQAVLASLLVDQSCPCGAPADAILPDASFRCDGHITAPPQEREKSLLDGVVKSPFYLRIFEVLFTGMAYEPDDLVEKLIKLGMEPGESNDTVWDMVDNIEDDTGALIKLSDGKVRLRLKNERRLPPVGRSRLSSPGQGKGAGASTGDASPASPVSGFFAALMSSMRASAPSSFFSRPWSFSSLAKDRIWTTAFFVGPEGRVPTSTLAVRIAARSIAVLMRTQGASTLCSANSSPSAVARTVSPSMRRLRL